MIKNSKGNVYYGMHFYPGVAEYREPGKDPYRVFLNEDTLRAMDPTFAGRPVFVQHVDEVEANPDELRKDADGWVVESFFNSADGKHWVKFIAVTEKAEQAIKSGWKLSNAYIPKTFDRGGLWNGVAYQKQITNGEFEHMAIVSNPRYEESIILTPEQFKAYCEEKELELKKLANSKDKGENPMKFNLWKKQKVENSTDIEGMMVTLPKSKKEVTLSEIISNADEMASEGMNLVANGDHHVVVGEEKMKVNDLVKKYQDMCNELAELKKKANEPEQELDLEVEPKKVDVEGDKQNDEDEEAKKKALQLAEHEEKEIEEKKKQNALAEEKKKKEAEEKKKNFDKLKNARDKAQATEAVKVDLAEDRVMRGKARYGSA